MDSFLTEAKDQHGNERSLERLNKDRHLFVKKMEEIIADNILEVREDIEWMKDEPIPESEEGRIYNQTIQDILDLDILSIKEE